MNPPITKLPEGPRDPKLQFDAEEVGIFAPPSEGPAWRDDDELTPDELEEHWNP